MFERLRAALRDELGADPEPPTRALFHELLHAAGITGHSCPTPGRQPAGTGHAAIGRDRELTETDAALRRTRLLTLTGSVVSVRHRCDRAGAATSCRFRR